MPEYRRIDCPGATIFFTVVTHDRRPILGSERSVALLRQAFREERKHHPFEIDAAVILPDHLHCIWTLPPDDAHFSMRWTKIKGRFTSLFLAAGGSEGRRNASRAKRSERAVWQRRYWDRVIRDDREYGAYMDYIHYNPVKHGLVRCPHEWPHSSFRRWVAAGAYAEDWLCACAEPKRSPDFGEISARVGE